MFLQPYFLFPSLLAPIFHGKPADGKGQMNKTESNGVSVLCQSFREPPPLRFPDLGCCPLGWVAKSGHALEFVSYTLLS